MFDNEGHYIDDPLVVVNAEPDFSGIGEIPVIRPMEVIKMMQIPPCLIYKNRDAVFADFDRMIPHLARVHNLKQDDIMVLLADWFYSHSPEYLRVDIERQATATQTRYPSFEESQGEMHPF